MRTARRLHRGAPPSVRALAVCLALGLGGWAFGMVASLLAVGHFWLLGYSTQTADEIALSVAFNVVGAGGTAFAYLVYRRNGVDWPFIVSFLRLRRPRLVDVGWVVVGLVGAFVVLIGVNALVELLDPFATDGEGETHSGIEEGRDYPVLFLIGIPLAILLTGPGEELLFRGVIQSRLKESVPTVLAVLGAGLVFGVVHFPAYMGNDLGQVLVSVTTVTALGLYFGVLYEVTNTLTVPALVHGCFNAVVYLLNYLSYA